MYAILNGKLVKHENLMIPGISPAVDYGYGLFETLKVKDGKICFFEEHLHRMKDGCNVIGMSIPKDDLGILADMTELILANGVNEGSIRMKYLRNGEDSDLIITTGLNRYQREDYKSGFAICLADVQISETSRLNTVKSNNYLEHYLEREAAAQKGFQESIFCNTRGMVCEGTFCNLFFVKDHTLCTPKQSCGLLPGIMRQHVLSIGKEQGYQIYESEFTQDDVYGAEEVFLTNSLLEIMPVHRFDHYHYSLENNPVTRNLIRSI